MRLMSSAGTPDEASFSLGIRNLGPVPASEAVFDDVVVTGD